LKLVASTPAESGRLVTYGIVVTNAGPGAARDVTVTDALPKDAELISATPSSGVCSVATCAIGELAPGATVGIAVVVRLNPDVTDPVANAACATTTSVDPDASNNCANTTGVLGAESPASATPGGDSGTSWGLWLIIAGGAVIVLGGATYFIARRRGGLPHP
jgi:uncharacterized repeat protein (TIGR01451 family)